MPMNEAKGATTSTGQLVNGPRLADVVAQQLEVMLSSGNYDAVKMLLEPVQPVDTDRHHPCNKQFLPLFL